MTPNKEDYLKLIFELGGDQHQISNKQIVTGLHVSPASVSEMISKLERDGFVEHSPYQGVKLTETGLHKANTLVRKHRLWEVFLMKHLGYSWNAVHEEAEILEHVTSEELINRLEAYLNYPSTCPHGGVIPRRNEQIREKDWQTLAAYSEKTTVQIERVLDEKELLNYLGELCLNIHDIVTIEEIGAYEGPISLRKSTGELVAVSHKAALNIFVKPVNAD